MGKHDEIIRKLKTDKEMLSKLADWYYQRDPQAYGDVIRRLTDTYTAMGLTARRLEKRN